MQAQDTNHQSPAITDTTPIQRREAKWQFRRELLLRVADLLETQPEQVWPRITRTLERQLEAPSKATRDTAKRWRRFAGNTPEKVITVIRRHFLTDTPEGLKRYKLQDLTDGHPFAGVLPDQLIRLMRQNPGSCHDNPPAIQMPPLPKPTSATEAMKIARKAAARLRAFGATRVILFGSLARGTYTPGESDIDVYFEGIDPRKSDLAMLKLVDEFGEEIIDPIPADCCPAYIKERIDLQGVEL